MVGAVELKRKKRGSGGEVGAGAGTVKGTVRSLVVTYR